MFCVSLTICIKAGQNVFSIFCTEFKSCKSVFHFSFNPFLGIANVVFCVLDARSDLSEKAKSSVLIFSLSSELI